MRCPDVVERLSAYVDGELGPSEAQVVQSHLAQCPRCQQRHGLLAAARSAVRQLPRETVSPGFEAAFRRRLGAEDGVRRPRRLRPRVLVLATGLAASLALALLVSPGRSTSPDAVVTPRTRPLVIPASRWEGLDCGSRSPMARCWIDLPCASAATCGHGVGVGWGLPRP